MNCIDSDIKEIDHIKKLIIVIYMIKDEKIGNYPLDKEDYNIEGEDLKYRVDISYMHMKIYGKEIKNELLS